MTRTKLVLALSMLPSLCGLAVAQDGTPKPATTAPQPQRAARLMTAPPQSSEPTQAELAKKLEEKLAKPFLGVAKWTTDYDGARARAKEEHKLIFTYFTRSYAY